MTNYERIKSMTVEEMAAWINDTTICDMCANHHKKCLEDSFCYDGIEDWLESEVKK